jgi:hypothetical protein
MPEAHEQTENNAGIAGAWMLFIIMVGASFMGFIIMFGFILFFAPWSFSRIVNDLPVPTPDYPQTSPGFPGVGGGDDAVIPDTGIFDGGTKIDDETCAQLESMSNQQAYEMYQKYCL